MGTYGRNFEFRIVPIENDRKGRYVLGGSTPVPIGAPIVVPADATPDSAFTDALPVELATGGQPFKQGFTGILVYEHIDFWEQDPLYTTASDIDTAPVGKLVQLASGAHDKVVFRNTSARSFLGTRDYAGRVMVAGMGATPTVAVGDLLTPGTGTDADGYWATTQTAANGWLVVTNVDPGRQEVEAQFNF